ncbi:MAG TPA: hypothetical protein VF120_05515, partial [Ktedonobacterales bacterium]
MSILPTKPEEAAIADVTASPSAVYEARLSRFTALRDQYNRQRYLAANLTVVLFFAVPACLAIAVFALFFNAPLFVALALLFAAGFLVAFAWQARLDGIYRRYDLLRTLCLEGLARLRRDWDALPMPPAIATERVPEFAGDLDLLGRASLQQLLSGVASPSGQIRLHEWLLAPASPEVVRERQPAAAELAQQFDFRQELALAGRQMQVTPVALERFLDWASGDAWLARRPWLLWLARLSPLLLFVLLVAEFAGLTRYPFWLLFLGLNLLLNAAYAKHIEDVLAQVSERQAVYRPYAALLRLVTTQPFTAPALRHIQGNLAAAEAGGVSAEEWMRRLARILAFADVRLSMFFAVIQATTLWSFHSLWMLERWQRVAGRKVRGWLATLSELDALAALGTLAFDNPTWAFPALQDLDPAPRAFAERPYRLEARGLAHPLLPPSLAVGNDVAVGPPGTFVFVTGSNMSGKSTLLRALGVNSVLAQMGAPVCASNLVLPPLALATSIRVQDSLEQGVSYFLAELQRLKVVLAIAQETADDGERIPFFLLDEILHGTNTSERQIAARSILRHLLAVGAMGAVSTHDLTLADAPDLQARRTAVYFTEQFTRGPEGPTMCFDYTLRPGVAPSTNALKLMEIVGLPV